MPTTRNPGVSPDEASVAKLEMGVSFDMLKDDEIWICDTGASSHSTNCITGASNQRDSGSASIGHAGQAVRATKTIDLSGTFVKKDGSRGLKATLTEVSYCADHNFNLLSLTRLLCQGWKIVNGDATGITIVHEESGGASSSTSSFPRTREL